MRAVFLISMKDLLLLRREPVALFFILIFPIAFGLLFGAIFAGAGGGGSAVQMALVDRDRSERSRGLADLLAGRGAVELTPMQSFEDARDAVRRGEFAAALRIPAGYDEGPPLFGGVQLVLLVDPSRGAESKVLRGVVSGAAMEEAFTALADPARASEWIDQARDALNDQDGAESRRLQMLLNAVETFAAGQGGANGEASSLPPFDGRVAVEEVAPRAGPSAWELTFPQASAWALLGCVTGFGTSLARERSSGTLLRLSSLPIGRRTVLAGKALACLLATLGVLAGIQVIGAAALGVRIHSPAASAAAIFSAAVAFVGLTMLLAVVGRTERATEGMVRAALLLLALVGGAGVPLFFMPEWMQSVAAISPFRWAILALEGASFRAFDAWEMAVVCSVMLGIGAVGALAGAAWHTRAESGNSFGS